MHYALYKLGPNGNRANECLCNHSYEACKIPVGGDRSNRHQRSKIVWGQVDFRSISGNPMRSFVIHCFLGHIINSLRIPSILFQLSLLPQPLLIHLPFSTHPNLRLCLFYLKIRSVRLMLATCSWVCYSYRGPHP